MALHVKIALNFSMSHPSNVKELERFLSMTNEFWKFNILFSIIALLLYKLLFSNTYFIWDNNWETAFEKLKSILHSTKILAHPKYFKLFVLFTDASNHYPESCLEQPGESSVLRPLGYFSKTLSTSKINYSTTKMRHLPLSLHLNIFCIFC